MSGSSGGIGTGDDYTTIKRARHIRFAADHRVVHAGQRPVGTVATITRCNVGVTAVTFHLTSASYTVISGTQIQATVPAGASTGRIRVTTAAALRRAPAISP